MTSPPAPPLPPVAGAPPHPRLARVCIVMMSAVGDAVHVLPVIMAIKRAHPAARISWVLQPGPATLVRGHRAVDEIILFDRSAGLRGFLDVRRALARHAFDVVLDLQVYFKAGIVTAFTHAPVKLGFDRARARDFNWLFTTHRIPPHAPQHVQDQYFEFLDALAVRHDIVEWDLGPHEGEERRWQREFFSRLDRPAVALVVATSKPEKDWVPERWAEVVDALYYDWSLQPVIIGGTSERERHAERVIAARARHRPIAQLGCGLRKVVAILDGAALAISPDTGPLHISVALDRPVVSLMGYTNPRRTGPYRRFHDLIVDAYGDPGEDYPVSAEWRPGRMERIAVRDVLDAVERWRARYAPARPGPRTGQSTAESRPKS